MLACNVVADPFSPVCGRENLPKPWGATEVVNGLKNGAQGKTRAVTVLYSRGLFGINKPYDATTCNFDFARAAIDRICRQSTLSGGGGIYTFQARKVGS